MTEAPASEPVPRGPESPCLMGRISYRAKCCGLTLSLATERVNCFFDREGAIWLLCETAARARLDPDSVHPIRFTGANVRLIGLTDGTIRLGSTYRTAKVGRVATGGFHSPACEAIRSLCEHAGPEIAAEMTAGYATWCRSKKTAPPGSAP